MTWQERLFEVEPTLSIPGIGDVPLEIKGERVQAEYGDVFEARVFVRVNMNEEGNPKMNTIGDFTGDPKKERKASVIKAFTELVRQVPERKWEDMRKTELLIREREAREAKEARVQSLHPAAV